MPDVQTTTEPPRTGTGPAGQGEVEQPDPIASLKKMSTTAGIGYGTEYVAVNPVAVAALLLGVGSLLVFLHDVLLVVPLAGIVCAVIALRQINNSNGTQTGRVMALAGLGLSVLLGGGRLAWQMFGGWTNRADREEVARLVSQLGEHVSNEEYGAAYALFTPRFQERVSPQKFADAYKTLNSLPEGGGIKSMRWNELVEFQEDPQTGGRHAYTMAFLSFKKVEEPGRQTIHLFKQGNRWMIEDVPAVFPQERKRPAGPGGAGRGTGAGPSPLDPAPPTR